MTWRTYRLTFGEVGLGAGFRNRFGIILPERPSVLDEFIAAWERGEAPAVEEYLDRLAPADSREPSS